MKQKLLTLLKPKIASKGFGPKTLEGLADHLAKNLTEESTDDEINTAIDRVMPFAELMQAENTRYANEVKGKMSKVEEVKTTETKTEEAKAADPILAMLQELRGELAAIKGEKVVNTRKEQYAKTLDGTDAKYKAKALKDFERISSTFKDDDEFSEWLTSESEVAKDFVATEPAFGIDRPAGGAGKPAAKEKVASKESIDAIMKTI